MAASLQQAGHDALHTLDLPVGNHTPDNIISELSINERRIVVTKDSDFVDSFILRQEPWKLLLVSTGNIHNAELIAVFSANVEKIAHGFNDFHFIEITRTEIIFHS